MLAFMGFVIGAPALINIGNRVFEEILIPNKEKKNLANLPPELGEAQVFCMDMVVLPGEAQLLDKMGVIEILGECSARYRRLVGKTPSSKMRRELGMCDHCNRPRA